MLNPENASGISFTIGWAMTLKCADPDEAIRRAGDQLSAVTNTGEMAALAWARSACTPTSDDENLTYYTRHGYVETHRAEQDEFRRTLFRKPLD